MDWGTAGHVDLAVKSPFTPNMPKKISDMTVEKVPSISNRFSLFQSKLQIAHYAQGSIIDYCHALYEAVVYLSKSLDDFTQADVDGYLQYLLSRKPMPAEAQFKHFVYGLKFYRSTMGLSALEGLALPKIRRERKQLRIMSVRELYIAVHQPRGATKCWNTSDVMPIVLPSATLVLLIMAQRRAWSLTTGRTTDMGLCINR